MIDAAIVTAIRARLTSALAPPRERMCPIRVDGHAAGWVDRPRAARLAAFDDVFRVDPDAIRFLPQLADEPSRSRAVDRIVRTLAAEKAADRVARRALRRRARSRPAAVFLLERAAARYFGIRTFAVHVNGLVDAGGTAMWIARRSPAKSIDPGLLDNLVGGGIAAGATIAGTLVKESQEEAGIDAALAATRDRPGRLTSAACSPTACSARRSSSTISRCRATSGRPARTAKRSSTPSSTSMPLRGSSPTRADAMS